MKTIAVDARFFGPSHTGLGRYTQALISGLYQLKPQYQIYLLSSPQVVRYLKTTFPRVSSIILLNSLNG